MIFKPYTIIRFFIACTLLYACKKSTSQSKSIGFLGSFFGDDSSAQPSAVPNGVYSSKAACLTQVENQYRAQGIMPSYLSCAQNAVTTADRNLLAKLCTDDIPRACGMDPNVAQQQLAQSFPTDKNTVSLNPFQQCTAQKEQEAKISGRMPSYLSCDQPAIGYANSKLLGDLCDGEFLNACYYLLPAADQQAGKEMYLYNTDGKVGPFQNPPCAPNQRGQFNADCSAVSIPVNGQMVEYQLTPIQICQNQGEVAMRNQGKWPVPKEIDCGAMVADVAQRDLLDGVCQKIYDDCLVKYPLDSGSIVNPQLGN